MVSGTQSACKEQEFNETAGQSLTESLKENEGKESKQENQKKINSFLIGLELTFEPTSEQ